MAMTTVFLNANETHLVAALREAGKELDGTEGEVILDLSSVIRIDSNVLHGLEDFASNADGKHIKVVLRGVNVEVYKVLKLIKLTRRFSFVN